MPNRLEATRSTGVLVVVLTLAVAGACAASPAPQAPPEPEPELDVEAGVDPAPLPHDGSFPFEGSRTFELKAAPRPIKSTPPGFVVREALRFGTKGMGPGQIMNARTVAVDPEGFIYAGDSETGRVLRFTSAGKFDSLFWVADPKRYIGGLASDRRGGLWVVNGGRLLRYEAATGKLTGEAEHPDGPWFTSVAPTPDGGVIAGWRNASHDDVVLIDREGKVSRIFNNVVGALDQIVTHPVVAMDGRKNFYVLSDSADRVFRFGPDGKYLDRFGRDGDEPGDFSGIVSGLAVDGQGRLYTGDFEGVIVFDLEGRFLARLDVDATGLAVSDQDELITVEDHEVVKLVIVGRGKSELD